MNFYKAKYLKNNAPAGRTYTFKSEEILSPGDKAETPDGKHVQIVDEPVDADWIKAYGIDNIKQIIRKVEEDERNGN